MASRTTAVVVGRASNEQEASQTPAHGPLYFALVEERVTPQRSPGLHLRLKVHQAMDFLCPQIKSEPVGGLVPAVPTLDVISEHSAPQKT